MLSESASQISSPKFRGTRRAPRWLLFNGAEVDGSKRESEPILPFGGYVCSLVEDRLRFGGLGFLGVVLWISGDEGKRLT